jgi:uncharacterized membrane protein YukC
MEKRLKKVQRGASVGFVLLKILRILLIIAAVYISFFMNPTAVDVFTGEDYVKELKKMFERRGR